ncbi:MAG: HAD family phosphatase [Candidatus Paceibacterota bacterium]
MNPKLTTFIFDCFGVVCSPVLNSWYKEYSLKTGFVDQNLRETFRKFDLGILSEDDIVEYFLKYKGVTATKEELRDELDRGLKFDDELLKVIKELKNRGFKIMLLSNANQSFFDRKVYPSNPEFKNLFDEVIISSSVQMIKPNADIFLYALEKIGSKAEESLFIDDSKQNVDAAMRLGMQGFVYTDIEHFVRYLKTLLEFTHGRKF